MRSFLCIFLFLAAGLVFPASGQDESEIKKINADIESLIAANASAQRRISDLAEAVRSLRDETKNADKGLAAQAAIHEDMKKIADKIQEVDRKRQADKELILEQLDKIRKFIESNSGGKSSRSIAPPGDAPKERKMTDIPEKGFEYVVQPGDYLPKIIKAVNQELKSKGMKTVTTQQVLDANPGLKPSLLRPNQKIFIPSAP